MAGIGFELKKLFRRKGLFAWLRAYGYAGIICTGPMLLGIALQLGILLLCSWAGAERTQQDLLVCMVTYTLLSSLTVTSFFSMPVTRYLADMLYEEREDAILPSFWGSSVLMLLIGLYPVRHLSVVLRSNAPAGAVMFMAVCRDDPELERHELPDRYQGLPGYPVLFSGGDRAVFRAGISARLYSGCSCTGRHAVFHYHGVWPDDGVGCGAALPLFPAKR